jgi:K+-sensing histidine kinase KdpD
MRDRALWLLIPTSPPLVLGIVVAVALIAVATLAVYAERRVAQEISVGVVYLVAVFVVWTVWGLAFGAVTAVLAVIELGSGRWRRASGAEAGGVG